MKMIDSNKERIKEKLKRISKSDTTWIKKARKRAGLPEVGGVYEYYDNGYISTSHGMEATVLEIIPYNKAPIFLKEAHKLAVEESPQIYLKTTDYFVSVMIGDYDVDVLVRDKTGGWFGGIVSKYYGGVLDLDGSLKDTNTLRNCYGKKLHFIAEEGDEAFTDGYVLWLENQVLNKNDRIQNKDGNK